MFALLLCSILLLLPPPCHCEDSEQQIFGGSTFGKDQYLWFVALLEGITEDDFICSGALIGPRHVITADHCVRDKTVDSITARVGYYCRESDNCQRTFDDLEVIEHRRDPSLGDVAILVLASNAPSQFAPAIPDVGSPSYLSSVRKGGELLMVGAGGDGTGEGVAAQVETLQLQLRHANFKRCVKDISDDKFREEYVSNSTICSVSDQGKPCRGDSGAAILVENADAEGDVIVAVHNYGPKDCSGADDSVLFGHLALGHVAEFVISVVCTGNKQKPNWCRETSCSVLLSEAVCAPVCDSTCTPPSPTLCTSTLKATRLYNLKSHTRLVRSLAFDATSSRLASGGEDGKVNVWDPRHGGPTQMTFDLDGCCPRSVAFNPAGTMLAVDDGNDVAILNVWNTNAPDEVRLLQEHRGNVDAVAWNADGSMLASGSADDAVKLWDVDSGTLLHTFEGHEGDVKSVSFDRQGRYLASASTDSSIRIWDAVNLVHVRTLEGHASWVLSVAYSPDGTKLASGSNDGTLRIWDASDGAALGIFAIGSRVNSVAWSPDSQLLVSGSHDGIVRIWNESNNEEDALLEIKAHKKAVYAVAWSPNGKWIAAGLHNRMVKVWEVTC